MSTVVREKVIEVVLCWGSGAEASVLRIDYVSPGGTYAIGDEAGSGAVVPESAIGARRAEIVTWKSEPRVTAPPLRQIGIDGDAASATTLVLKGERGVAIELGDGLILRARLVERATFPRDSPIARGAWGAFGLSLFAHTACIVALGLAAPSLARASALEVERQHTEIRQHLLQASDQREALSDKPRPPPATTGHISIVSREAPVEKDQVDPEVRESESPPARPQRSEVTSFGVIGLLADPSEPTTPSRWAEEESPETAAAQRQMFADDRPGTWGPGGLTLSSAGLGGGGRATGVPLRDLGKLDSSLEGERARVTDGVGHVTSPRRSAGPPVSSPQELPSERVPPSVISAVVGMNGRRLQMCFGPGRRRNPTLHGRIDVAFSIDEKGAVREARDAGGELDDPFVRTCVVNVFFGLQFPAPPHPPQRVSFPVVFDTD